MKLNPDCIRSILLTVEDLTDGSNPIIFYKEYESDYPLLKHFKPEIIYYHVNQCELSGFFINSSCYNNGGFLIRDLSPKGHEFIADIRNDNNWNRVKNIASKVGSSSLRALTQIASNVTAELIAKKMRGEI